MNEDILVSVAMITYNHEKFIAQAIEGIVMQQTTFSFELIIGEDCSTDNTRQVCIEYQSRYPDKIRLFLPEKNVGAGKNSSTVLDMCKGKYIAVCEGDDYWVDHYKLQKQVDFLEKHPDYSICAGNFLLLSEGEKTLRHFTWHDDKNALKRYSKGSVVTLDNYLYPYLLQALTVCFKREYLAGLSKIKDSTYDDVLWAVLLTRGNGYVFPDIFGVYRRHPGGIWSGKNKKQKMLMDASHFEELQQYFVSKSILRRYYETKLEILFFDFAEEKNKLKTSFKIIKLTFSGKISSLPKRLSTLVKKIAKRLFLK